MKTRRTADDRCPDAELIAAWADGTLYGAAAESLEAHLADCERCQAVLATFAATEPDAVGVLATSQDVETPVRAAAPVIPFPERASIASWAVPLVIGALAASLFMFVVWPRLPRL